MGFITDEQQELLVDEQHEHPGQLLGKVAIDMGLVNEDQLVRVDRRLRVTRSGFGESTTRVSRLESQSCSATDGGSVWAS